MRKVGVQMMDSCGTVYTNGFLTLLEARIEAPSKKLDDHKRASVVVCLGSLAKDMDKAERQLCTSFSRRSRSRPSSARLRRACRRSCSRSESPLILDDCAIVATTGETFGDRMDAAFGVSFCAKAPWYRRAQAALRHSAPRGSDEDLLIRTPAKAPCPSWSAL